MSARLLTEQCLGFVSLKGGCTGLSEATLVKMPHCWKSHVMAQINVSMLYLVFHDCLRFNSGSTFSRRHFLGDTTLLVFRTFHFCNVILASR